MTLKEYTERAIQFAKDTKEWGHLDEFSHYRTMGRLERNK